MQLTRDAMGNYTYAYVADQEAIAKAEQELADAQNAVYNIDKDAAKENISEVFSLIEEGQNKVTELLRAGRKEEAKLVYDTYFGESGLVAGLTEEFATLGATLGAELGVDTPIFNMLKNMSNINYAELTKSISEAYSKAETALKPVTDELTELLDDQSPIVTSINSLTSAFENDVSKDSEGRYVVAGISDLVSNSMTIMTELASLTGALADDAGRLANLWQKGGENPIVSAIKDGTSTIETAIKEKTFETTLTNENGNIDTGNGNDFASNSHLD